MSDWIKWSGGECPVSADAFVSIECKDGQEFCRNAGIFDWTHTDNPGDIIAYRLHKPEQQPKPEQQLPPTEQLRIAIVKRDKQAEKAKHHADKLDQRNAEVQRLIGELEREIEEATGLVCILRQKEVGGIPDSSIPVGVDVHSDIPEGVDVDDPKTWQAGDVIELVHENHCHWTQKHLTVGNEYVINIIDDYGDGYPRVNVTDDESDLLWSWGKFRFVRRPN